MNIKINIRDCWEMNSISTYHELGLSHLNPEYQWHFIIGYILKWSAIFLNYDCVIHQCYGIPLRKYGFTVVRCCVPNAKLTRKVSIFNVSYLSNPFCRAIWMLKYRSVTKALMGCALSEHPAAKPCIKTLNYPPSTLAAMTTSAADQKSCFN